MIDSIYIEEGVREHPRTLATLARFPQARRIPCSRWGEVFNRRSQDFRLQKRRPALILAHKHGNPVLPAPPGYGIGGRHNYYFSHLLNCLYDCRYCFLQGMFRSASYVSYVNLEAFEAAIRATCEQHADSAESLYFFSGYDCDSLALEPVTGFLDFILPLFRELGRPWLELRTKSTQIRKLLATPAMANCVVAFSLSPDPIARAWEHRAPTLAARLDAAARLQAAGWPIGLRLDPVIDVAGAAELYETLLATVFRELDPAGVHSVSLGALRLPAQFHQRMSALYPDEPLLAGLQRGDDGQYGYGPREAGLLERVHRLLLGHMPPERVFQCST